MSKQRRVWRAVLAALSLLLAAVAGARAQAASPHPSHAVAADAVPARRH